MPKSRAICACDFPLLCANCTASSLNSFVKVLWSFGMMPSCWMLSFNFTSSKKVRQAQTSSVLHADYLTACDGAHSRIREALGVKAEGLGALDEYYIFVYFRADWSELIRGYEADAILIDRPDIRWFFLITDADRGMFMIQYAPSQGESAQDYTAERCKEL